MRWSLLAALGLALSLAACCGPPPVTTTCPSVREWSAADQAALDKALATVPEGSPIARMALDWSRMRDKLRACRR